MDAFLWEVAYLAVFGFADFTTIGFQCTTDAFHQGGLARAVMTSKGDTLLGHDGEGEVFEDDSGAELDAQFFDR